ncbi:VanW family protein [Natranaerobius thermophilus]|uniref:VanW family protein n=1 Tax=Natranaerobius thermophilus (strain ATCC BAA-1301 / DSM 18059 / JW/NM-WN-LF) TaxID=457570 RepID=B2A3X4_NATTJ|nr:VanW family protein [Natranaerobius thermophilus]ACB85076.1 VanW family protein [Natranaerobius thermophilus JW/NM-WN-LF]
MFKKYYDNFDKKSKKLISIVIPVMIFFMFMMLGLGGYQQYRYQNTFIPGISIAGINISEKSHTQVKKLLEQELENMSDQKIILEHQENTWEYNFHELGMDWMVKASFDKALDNDELSFFEGIKLLLAEISQDQEIQLEHELDESKTKSIVSNLRDEIAQKPQDAEYQVNKYAQSVSIKPHQNGKEIDESKFISELNYLLEQISQDLRSFTDAEFVIEIPTTTVEPDTLTEELQELGIDTLISTFETHYDEDDEQRVTNIELASEKLDNKKLEPGEKLSFNEVVGPRTRERGYQEAPVIIDGELVDGLGGGICQVSTTLYNSVLKAGIIPIERSPHGIPVEYVSLGRDAAVAYDYLDLVFENHRDNGILISTLVDENRLRVDIYGSQESHDYTIRTEDYQEIHPDTIYFLKTDDGERVEISQEEKQELLDTNESDENVNENDYDNEENDLEETNTNNDDKEHIEDTNYEITELQRGRLGYQIEVWLLTYKNDEKVDKEHIATDIYPSRDEKYLIELEDSDQ